MADQTMAQQNGSKKKVIVSGCFDLLHSGHVEFFLQAAQFGDLYVRLGTDANIQNLKGHTPMYSDAERLFMVKNLACVHDAALSTGSGRFDFKSDMVDLKPDIYVCCEDASGMETREKICRELGIEMKVLKRNPNESLKDNPRSSTDMKARLRAMIAEEDAKAQLEPMSEFNSTIPWRFCFAGGWMDLKWCNELYPGSVITLNFKFQGGICKDMCGLATSSRKFWRKLWNGKVPTYLEAPEAAKFLYGAENFKHFGKAIGTMPEWEKTSYSAGSQDHCGLMFPGISKLCYTGQHWPSSMINLNDASDPEQAAVFQWLEEHLYIVEIPFESRPGDYNSQRVNNLTDESIPRSERSAMVKALADASELAWEGITQRNADKLGQGLSDTMKAWEVMLPYTVDPYKNDDAAKSQQLREFWTSYDRPHTKGCLFSGAGGGFLMVISDTPVANAMQIKLNHDAICKPFTSDRLDSPPHPVPHVD